MANITDQVYALYERLASQKLNALMAQINSHNHGSAGGVAIDVNSAITAHTINGEGTGTVHHIALYTITGGVGGNIAEDTITNYNIAPGTITLTELNLTNIHITADGYATYAP